MKKILIIFNIIFLSYAGFTQDLIIKKSGEELKVKITEVSENDVKYKKTGFKTGPTFTISNANIFMIKYSNGEKQMFNNNRSGYRENTTGLYSEIFEGTVVALYAARTIASKNMQVGSLVEFRVKEAIVDKDNYVLIKSNQIVYATVNAASRAKGLGKEGTLSFMIQEIKAVDGQKIPAYLNIGSEGKNRAGASIAVGMLLFWPALLMKGKEAELTAGTLIYATISENRNIKINPDLKSSAGTSTSINNINDPNLINNTEEDIYDCGDKPKPPKNYNNPQYKISFQYKEYKRELRKWQDCIDGK